MRIVGKPPTEQQVRVDYKIPAHAKFLGWAIQATEDDKFLRASAGSYEAELRIFDSDPAYALIFPTVDAAGRLVVTLDRSAVITAMFDFGSSQIGAVPVGGNEHSGFNV